jgi:hypothetical protein
MKSVRRQRSRCLFLSRALLSAALLNAALSCTSAPQTAARARDVEDENAIVPAVTDTVEAMNDEASHDESPQETPPLETPLLSVAIDADMAELPVSAFTEVWAYLVDGREKSLRAGYPISDVVYFGAEIDSYGQLSGVPQRKKITGYHGRVHLALKCDSAGLTHFVLQPGSESRSNLINQLIAASKDYDGINIDLELVPARDGEHFLAFLAELRSRLAGKTLSAALPARTTSGGVYDYKRVAEYVDRIFVMAYDEHWSGSKPGPVASMNWCKTVAAYALKAVGAEKLVMGIPFYGRAWADTSTNRALIYDTAEKLREEHASPERGRENGIPLFTYEVPVTVTVYYEDAYSIAFRQDMYLNQGVANIGFWSLGQEADDTWRYLELK